MVSLRRFDPAIAAHQTSTKPTELDPAPDLLYVFSHRQDNTYHGLWYTSREALVVTGKRQLMGSPRRFDPATAAPQASAKPIELDLLPQLIQIQGILTRDAMSWVKIVSYWGVWFLLAAVVLMNIRVKLNGAVRLENNQAKCQRA